MLSILVVGREPERPPCDDEQRVLLLSHVVVADALGEKEPDVVGALEAALVQNLHVLADFHQMEQLDRLRCELASSIPALNLDRQLTSLQVLQYSINMV